jgi:hypothetical protein
VANGDFSGTRDVSTFLSSFVAFLTAIFSFFASFRSPFVFLDIRCAPPMLKAAWTLRRMSQAEKKPPGVVSPGLELGCDPQHFLCKRRP